MIRAVKKIPQRFRAGIKTQLHRRIFSGLMGLCCLFWLPGCQMIGFDAEKLLRPPKLSGEQKAIQEALEQYIAAHTEKGETSEYQLKYPKEGDHLAAFLWLNASEEDGAEATEAVAFYRREGEDGNARINYLKKDGETWTSIADIEGDSQDIGEVKLGDLDGDGRMELLVGWTQFSTRDRRLTVYTVDDQGLRSVFTTNYTALLLDEIVGDDRDDLLLINIVRMEYSAIARLVSFSEGTFIERGTARMDGYIQSIGKMQTVSLDEGVRGMYVDGYKDANTMVTELILWNGAELLTPLYETLYNSSRLTTRESTLPFMDIDGDGTIEWPMNQRLFGYEETDIQNAMWRTAWVNWDYRTGETYKVMDTIVNAEDGYYLRLEDTMLGAVTAKYDAQRRVLSLSEVRGGQVFIPFMIVRAELVDAPVEEDGTKDFFWLANSNTMRYTAWVAEDNPFGITMERMRYMFTIQSFT